MSVQQHLNHFTLSPPSSSLADQYSWRSIHPHAQLHYVKNLDHANSLLEHLQGPVGFDLEWRPSFKKGEPEHPISLVQLANDQTILLIQISAMKAFPTKLQEFLESPDSVKAGVAIQNDVKKLYRDFQVSMRNCVDLSLLARSVDNARWKGKYRNPLGLSRLVEAYQDLHLSKGKISRSNWEAELTTQQQEYAGNDAHSGYSTYEKLIAMSKLMSTPPKPVYYTFDAVRGRLCEPSGMHWSPFNPDYDPGPPPPPKVPKPPRTQDLVLVDAQIATSTSLWDNPSTHRNFSSQPYRSSGHANPRPRFTPRPNRGASLSYISPSLVDTSHVTRPSDPSGSVPATLEQPPKYSSRQQKRRHPPNAVSDNVS